MKTFSMMLILILLSLILHLLMVKSSKNQSISINQSANFECGFNSKSSSMIPYSSQYYSIAILFLIFDLEIVLFIPTVMVENMSLSSSMTSSMMMIMLYIIFLTEWKMNMIKWSK